MYAHYRGEDNTIERSLTAPARRWIRIGVVDSESCRSGTRRARHRVREHASVGSQKLLRGNRANSSAQASVVSPEPRRARVTYGFVLKRRTKRTRSYTTNS